MSEFSYLFKLDHLEEVPVERSIDASPEECMALAKRLNVLAVEKLSAKLKIERIQGYVVQVTGHLEADLMQECIVSLEPVQSHVEDDFDAYFAEKTNAVSFAKKKREHIMENQDPEVSFLDERDDPEPIIQGKIDLGELVTQYLSLSVNPYPQKEGEHYPHGDDEDTKILEDRRPKNPFAALEAMKKSLEE